MFFRAIKLPVIFTQNIQCLKTLTGILFAVATRLVWTTLAQKTIRPLYAVIMDIDNILYFCTNVGILRNVRIKRIDK